MCQCTLVYLGVALEDAGRVEEGYVVKRGKWGIPITLAFT